MRRSGFTEASLTLFLGSLASACALPVPAYLGPRRAADQVAILKADGSFQILQIDDQVVSGRAYELLPGRHVIRFKGTLRSEEVHPQARGQRATMLCQVTSDLHAGRSYRITKTRPEAVASSETFTARTTLHMFEVHFVDVGRDQPAGPVTCEWS